MFKFLYDYIYVNNYLKNLPNNVEIIDLTFTLLKLK